MADKNVIIKQKLENEIVDFYPKTKSNIVVNESTNVTGSTVTDVFNNALPLVNGNHTEVVQSTDGIKINFTGSLAPNVTVKGSTPITVTGGPNEAKTEATYTVSHNTSGLPEGGYTTGNASENTTTVINPGQRKDIKIPQISVDKYGHVTTAATDSVTITIPSTTNMVTGTDLTDNKIILGYADSNNSSKIKTSPYGISNDSTNSTNKDKTIWTQQAVETLINKKITEGAQYLGLVKAADNIGNGVLIGIDDTKITPNSPGDWVRVVEDFIVPYAANGNTSVGQELAHVGDILIYHINAGFYVWDVIHTEVDTDTWRPIKVGNTTLNASTTLTISGAGGITTALSGGTLTLTGTTYSVSQNANAKNKFTLTSSSGASTEIEINNVASAESAKKVASSLTIQLNGGTTEDKNKFTYNGSAAKPINITASAIGAAASSHDHGNITSDGRISSNDTPITSNSKIVITDDSGKIARSTIQFKANTTTKALTQAGTWETFLKANQNITINSGLKHKNQPSDSNVYIKGTASGTEPTLGKSGVGAGIYSAIEVNEQGIAIAGSQVIKYYASGITNQTIIDDAMLAKGGFAFVEI